MKSLKNFTVSARISENDKRMLDIIIEEREESISEFVRRAIKSQFEGMQQ